MYLTENQTDALTELINIGFSKSASSLSELTGYRILLGTPSVRLLPISELSNVLSDIVHDRIVTVHQIFNGVISGDAMLILNQNDSKNLVSLMLDDIASDSLSNASVKDVLSEVGNIMLNSCLGMFGNILKIRITFTVPHLQLETLENLIRTITIDNVEISYALMVSMEFRLRDKAINSYLILVLGITSLEQLLFEIEKLG
ncbi:MAG TPA: chemotaxis protein CheC [Bacteroidales bacterium]|nr:chemotaxis protein CheC [Bacteroidales bacterium]